MDNFPLMNERLYLYSPGINICFRVIIKETFDKDEIAEALKKVCLRHPLLHCVAEKDTDNNAWLVHSKNGLSVEYYKSTEVNWHSWYTENDAVPFNFSTGPLVKLCVITGNDTEIIILGHHIIGDGIGYLNVVKDMLLALDNRIDPSPQLPPYKPAERYFKETVLLEQPVKEYARYLNGEWSKNRIRFSEKEFAVFFEEYRKKYRPDLYMASLEENSLQKLLEKSRSKGLTVNEIITSAFSYVLMEMPGRKELRAGAAVNIRNDIVSRPVDCMGNFVSGISIRIHNDSENDFLSYTRNVSVLLREQLQNVKNRHLVVHFLNEFDKDLIESIMFASYGNFENSVSKKLSELIGEQPLDKGLGISNLGKHDFDNYKNIHVTDLQFIGPAFPANVLTVGVITVNNQMNFCLRFNEAEMKTGEIKKLYEKSIKIIEEGL